MYKRQALCHEMLPGAKIGPAPNISLVYPASCKDVYKRQGYSYQSQIKGVLKGLGFDESMWDMRCV